MTTETAELQERMRSEIGYAVRTAAAHGYAKGKRDTDYGGTIDALIENAAATVLPIVEAEVRAARQDATPSTSDGYHTFDELYEYRMLYHAHAAAGWLAAGIPVVKSWRHADGEVCFGGGWFIVTATLPTGQVSNHYPAAHWDRFQVPEVDLPPRFDGHTPQDVADRLYDALLPPSARIGDGA